MDVIVIGGGIAGVATAYQLRAAGHRVCVIERHATVAQGAAYGHSGIVLPTALDVWFGPTFMRARGAANAVLDKAGFGGRARAFARRLATLRGTDAFASRYALLRPLLELARVELEAVESRFGLEFEQRDGLLYVVRGGDEWTLAQSALEQLRRFEVPHHVLSEAQCTAWEHALQGDPPFAGGVRLDGGRIANCPLFVKQLKQVLDTPGDVQFLTGRAVGAIRLESQRAAVELAPREHGAVRGEVDVVSADVVVVAAGAGTLPLVAPHGLKLPLYPVRIHTLVAPVAHEECVPHATIVDAVTRIVISPTNQRLRIAGGAVLLRESRLDKPLPAETTEAALAMLGEASRDWVPGAAKISAALPWEGVKLLSSDGLPTVGHTQHPRLFVNAGHGPAGWAQALGSARVIADLVSGRAASVPEDTLAALKPDRAS